MKQTIRLNEAQFNRLVKESVKRVLKEDGTIHSEFESIMSDVISSLDKARDFARENADSDWYMFLNAIIGEIYDRL